jgi:hypothetical protein
VAKLTRDKLEKRIALAVSAAGAAAVLSTPFLGFTPTLAFIGGLCVVAVIAKIVDAVRQ